MEQATLIKQLNKVLAAMEEDSYTEFAESKLETIIEVLIDDHEIKEQSKSQTLMR